MSSAASDVYKRQAILISEKLDLKTKSIKRDKVHYIILKGVVHQEDITLVNIYAPNIGSPKYIRKLLEDFKKDIDSSTVIIGDFNSPLSTMDRLSKQKINKDIVALNNTLDQTDLIDIYRNFHPKEAKYTFFSNAHGVFFKGRPHGRTQTSLKKFKKIKNHIKYVL